MSSYRLFIPAAGMGTRLGSETACLSKALVEIGNKPAIAWVVEKFASAEKIVVALGYGGEEVREFLGLAYPERSFEFVQISPYFGPGSSLGTTLRQCAHQLQCPFVFSPCDTIVLDHSVPPPDRDWVGYSSRNDVETQQYRKLVMNSNRVHAIAEKNVAIGVPYIGLCGIKNYARFWSALADSDSTIDDRGEIPGLEQLFSSGLEGISFDWLDTGCASGLKEARDFFEERGPIILEKVGEKIWFVNGRVIKYSEDQRFIKNRVQRSALLKSFVPQIEAQTAHMYSYPLQPGAPLSEHLSPEVLRSLLNHMEKFWLPATEKESSQTFSELCRVFYRDKTQQRVSRYFLQTGTHDHPGTINGRKCRSVAELLNQLDWMQLSNGIPVRFHGDFHSENILYNSATEKFTLLDWRQDFGGETNHGDLYYDLAKFNHGLIISHRVVKAKRFSITKGNLDEIFLSIDRDLSSLQCQKLFLDYVATRGLDPIRVNILTAIVFLNIASLHSGEYGDFLFQLGKLMLDELLHYGSTRFGSPHLGSEARYSDQKDA